MKPAVVVTSLFLLAACTREKVIVIHDQADSKQGAATSTGAETPIAPSPNETNAEWGIKEASDAESYDNVVDKVSRMTSDAALQTRVSRRGLSLVNVTWEDTGRSKGSSLGPNISDLTLQVRRKDAENRFQSSIMPVVRPPNFADRTGDIPSDRFFVRVGNQKGNRLESVPLVDVLKNMKGFASHPDSILGDGNLFASRDSHFLVSAQAVFLPIPKSGKAQFNPVLFNYQSAPGSPAVMTILITRQGSSISVIENKSEDATAAGWGQELYFDNKGQRAAFTAERKSDVAQRIAAQGGPKTEDDQSSLQKGADVLFLVQIPLKHANVGRLGGAMPASGLGGLSSAGAPMVAPMKSGVSGGARAEKSDVEQAVLGHGPNLGPFDEGHRLRLVRDPQFPVRVTVQFYKATSNGIVSDIDLDSITKSIGSVYEHADSVGSLVMPDGDPKRPTAWQKVPHEWFPW